MDWILIIAFVISLNINVVLFYKFREAKKVISEVSDAAADFIMLSELVSQEIAGLKETGGK